MAGSKLTPVSDAAIKAKTGRGWKEWCKLLDAAGAKKMSHAELARYVDRLHKAGGWHSQAVAVGYERLRGLRAINQRRGGSFEVSASKTLPAAAGAVFTAFTDARKRASWLGKPVVIRKATRPKSVRITWKDDTGVQVWITPKGKAKSVVSVQHGGLPDAKAVARGRKFWKAALEKLAARIAPGG